MNKNIPVYIKIKEDVKRKISEGVYRKNMRLPSENLLSEELGVSRMTVRRALDELTREGILYRTKGSGTYVSPNKFSQCDIMSFSEILYIIRDTGIVGVFVRFCFALICGGLIGLEREYKRRGAGFRTHTLICIGASITTLTGLFLYKEGLATDPMRIGAQVISGMGFIGAGTIIVTARRQVKGLTTAAGLWTSAVIGLAIGAGYYEAAIIGVILVLIAEIALVKFEHFIISTAKLMNVYIEFEYPQVLDNILAHFSDEATTITDMEFNKSNTPSGEKCNVVFTIRFKKRQPHDNIMAQISSIPGVITVEEL
jgi:putative Mg2+ transporter-C (MgtC) family protein